MTDGSVTDVLEIVQTVREDGIFSSWPADALIPDNEGSGPWSDDHEFGEDCEILGIEGVDARNIVRLHGRHELQIEDIAPCHGPALQQFHPPADGASGYR